MKLYAKDLIDAGADSHVHFHRSFKYYTIEHNHDFYEFFLITSGSVLHVANGIRRAVHRGGLVFIRPDDVHRFERRDNAEAAMININFHEETVQETFAFLGPGYEPMRLLACNEPPAVSLAAQEIQRFEAHAEQLLSLSSKHAAVRKTHDRSFLFRLLLDHFGTMPNPSEPDTPAWLADLLARMEQKEHYTAGIHRLYEFATISPEHLSRAFRKYTGMTPTAWINRKRIEYASFKLKHSNEAILSIMLDAGFNNTSHFYASFVSEHGMSPGEFRKRYAKQPIPE